MASDAPFTRSPLTIMQAAYKVSDKGWGSAAAIVNTDLNISPEVQWWVELMLILAGNRNEGC